MYHQLMQYPQRATHPATHVLRPLQQTLQLGNKAAHRCKLLNQGAILAPQALCLCLRRDGCLLALLPLCHRRRLPGGE